MRVSNLSTNQSKFTVIEIFFFLHYENQFQQLHESENFALLFRMQKFELLEKYRDSQHGTTSKMNS